MNKILVVVDMQNDFLSGSLRNQEGQEVIQNVVEKIKKYKKDSQEIYVTMDTHNEEYLETQEGRFLPVEHCIKGQNGWELDKVVQEELKDYPNIKFFEKPSFGSIELGEYIKQINKNKKIDEIEFIGVCTDICVISNVVIVKAQVPEVLLTVDASCCAGVNQRKHEATIEVMKSLQVNIING